MKIAIDIPEEIVEWINEYYYIIKGFNGEKIGIIVDAIKNGIPLPKGHGRLGDLDALYDEISSWGMNDYEPSDLIDAIDDAPTIIEADKAESEVNE